MNHANWIPKLTWFSEKGRNCQGHALVMAIVFVLFLTLFGLAFFQLAQTDVDLIGNDRNSMAALYAARAGIQKAAWVIKNHKAIEGKDGSPFPNLNPFSPSFYSDNRLLDFQQAVHENQEILSPGGNALPRYFRINQVDGRVVDTDDQSLIDCLRVQVLGALDMDGDGEAGLTGLDSQGFPIDWDDVNRKFEAIIGLPGSLAENLSAGAPSFTYGDGATSVSFANAYEQVVSQDGYDVPQASGFFYHQLLESGWYNWNRYDYIFGKPTRQGEIKLPPGLFDDTGSPQLAYFAELGPRQYEGDQVFDSDNDPTEGVEGRDIIYVNGNVTIDSVDFGHLDGSGVLRGSDWENTDVTVISTGTLTARDIRCGNVGRLTLIARDILLVGNYDTRVNGIALASGTITLDDQENGGDPHGCPYGVLKHMSPAEPIRYTAYFMGTMLADSSINLRNSGWTVLFDEKVINGFMYDTTLVKPTLVYETAENEAGDFPYPKWQEEGNESKVRQEEYTPEEDSAGVAASWHLGGDETPNVMRIYQAPIWRSGNDDHDFGETDGVYLGFPGEDWSVYRALTFWMSLDNWKKVSGSRETLRMSYFRVELRDALGKGAYFPLSDNSHFYDTLNAPGDGVWKKVRIPLSGIDPTSNFDVIGVSQIQFYFNDLMLSWYNAAHGVNQWIDHDPDRSTGYGSDGLFIFHLGYTDPWGKDAYPVRFRLDAGKHKLFYTEAAPGIDPHQRPGDAGYDAVYDIDIQWNPDPATPTVMEDLYFEDHLDPNLRIDQIQVPGKPATNGFLEYGLPRCFRYAVTHLQELNTF